MRFNNSVWPTRSQLTKTWLREVRGHNFVTHLCARRKGPAKKSRKGDSEPSPQRMLVTGRMVVDPDSGEVDVRDVRTKTVGQDVAAVEVSSSLDVAYFLSKDCRLTSESLSDADDGDKGESRLICNVGHRCGEDGLLAQLDDDYVCVAAGNRLCLVNVTFSTVVAELEVGSLSGMFVAGSRILLAKVREPSFHIYELATSCDQSNLFLT